MANSYVRVWSSILDSSIWSAPEPHRIVWITLLAMSDEHGFVGASIDGIARRANVSEEDAEAAMLAFQQPDPRSRDCIADPDNEGRRVRPVERGWHIINHSYYRALRDKEERREYERKRKAEQRARVRRGHVGDMSETGPESPAKSAHSPSASPSPALEGGKEGGTPYQEQQADGCRTPGGGS